MIPLSQFFHPERHKHFPECILKKYAPKLSEDNKNLSDGLKDHRIPYPFPPKENQK